MPNTGIIYINLASHPAICPTVSIAATRFLEFSLKCGGNLKLIIAKKINQINKRDIVIPT